MLPWIIIKTAARREAAVAAAIAAMGHETWLPLETRWRQKRKNRRVMTWQAPALPRMLFAQVPEAVHGDLQRVRYFDAIGRDAALRPVSVPYGQIVAFMGELDSRNQRARRLYELSLQGRQTIKPVKIRLGAGSDAPEATQIAALIKRLRFGTAPIDTDLAA